MLNNDDNKNETFTLEVEEAEEVSYGDADVWIQVYLENATTTVPMKYDDEMKRYLNVIGGEVALDTNTY